VSVSSSSSCIVTTNGQYTSNCVINTSTRTIKITGVFASSTSYTSSISIELGTVTNPTDNSVLNGFIINTYNDVNMVYNIDVLNNNILLPSLECNYPCETCSTSNKNDCTSCWLTGSYPYL
jgi:hypothetical protein